MIGAALGALILISIVSGGAERELVDRPAIVDQLKCDESRIAEGVFIVNAAPSVGPQAFLFYDTPKRLVPRELAEIHGDGRWIERGDDKCWMSNGVVGKFEELICLGQNSFLRSNDGFVRGGLSKVTNGDVNFPWVSGFGMAGQPCGSDKHVSPQIALSGIAQMGQLPLASVPKALGSPPQGESESGDRDRRQSVDVIPVSVVPNKGSEPEDPLMQGRAGLIAGVILAILIIAYQNATEGPRR